MKNIWTLFSKKTINEKIEILKENSIIDENFYNLLINKETLDADIANQISENTIGTFGLPFSLVPNILVNGKNYTVPMVTEEPSVVAACSYAAKLISKSGGFNSTINDKLMIGEVCLYNIPDFDFAISNIMNKKNEIIKIANEAYPSIVARNGGAIDLQLKIINGENVKFLVAYLTVDTKEAMGANIVNTMLEAIKSSLVDLSQGEVLMGILSNYATKSLVTSKCEIDIKYFSNNFEECKNIARKIELASEFAKADIYRATTHNKGIFNGIDAVVIATGNDFRAIEASGHAYASSKTGRYEGLTTWKFDENSEKLIGELTLPITVGTVGGSIGLNPSVKLAFHILQNIDAKTLSNIIVSIGLAQNFAALKALVTTGIQSGHMKLQARSLALLSGAKKEEINEVVAKLLETKKLNSENAKNIIKNLRQNK